MFRERFSHYLSYGATDQQTASQLAGQYNGLLIPGTVAAFQREGTGGFVLSLSAMGSVPYVIDPRFPLFQQALMSPKKSHQSLAELVGFADLVTGSPPNADWFTDERIEEIGRNWANFNLTYQEAQGGKFNKYAQRLGHELPRSAASGPAYILPPYFVLLHQEQDDWWDVSVKLFAATQRHSQGIPCVRVVATSEAAILADALDRVTEDRVVVWVSGLDEVAATEKALDAYASAVDGASTAGKQVFSLYGGFFAVLLASRGLRGSSHGIGFGESRNWQELPVSGPPPRRYYLPTLHRFVSQEFATQLWARDPALVGCDCPECEGAAPILLEYQPLMKHSVYSRALEIEQWTLLSAQAAAARLEEDLAEFRGRVAAADFPEFIQINIARNAIHMERWIQVLGS